MWIDRLLDSRSRHALELTARYAETRQQVLAENLANIDTPDYRAKRLDASDFQSAMREAIGRAEQSRSERLELPRGGPFSTDGRGRLVARPVVEPAENVLFHDGTSARLEELVKQANENQLLYRFVTTELRNRFEGLMTAIRGRVS